MRPALASVLLASSFAVTARASDVPPTPETQLFYSDLTVIRYNPLGLQNQFELDWRHRLYDPGDSLVMAQNFWSIGVAPVLTPGSCASA